MSINYVITRYGTVSGYVIPDELVRTINAQRLDSLDSTDFSRASHTHGLTDLAPLNLTNDGWVTANSAVTGTVNVVKVNTVDVVEIGTDLQVDGSILIPTNNDYYIGASGQAFKGIYLTEPSGVYTYLLTVDATGGLSTTQYTV